MTMPTTVRVSRWGRDGAVHAAPGQAGFGEKPVGSLSNEETVEFRAEPGRHALRAMSVRLLPIQSDSDPEAQPSLRKVTRRIGDSEQ